MKISSKFILVIVFSALVVNTFAQKVITGKVTNKATGKAIPGVTVRAKETDNGTITNKARGVFA